MGLLGAYAASRYSRSDRLQLKHMPVWPESLQVWEETGAYAGQGAEAFGDDALLTAGSDYYLDLDNATYSESGQLIKTAGTWPTEPRSIKVTYYGGWKPAQFQNGGPAQSIKFAMILTVAKAFKEALAHAKNQGPLTAETIGKWSASYANATALGMNIALPAEVVELLQRFRNYGRALA